MGFNSAFKGLKLLKKNPGNGRLNNLNDLVLNVLKPAMSPPVQCSIPLFKKKSLCMLRIHIYKFNGRIP